MDDHDHRDALASALAARVAWKEADELWQGVARGEREAEEVTHARELAGDLPEEIARDHALFHPLDQDELDALAELMPAPSQAATAENQAQTEVVTDLTSRRGRSAWVVGALLVAAAAAFALWWGIGDGVRGSEETLVAELPSYDLDTDGGLRTQRGEPPSDERHYYRAETTFHWTLSPHWAVKPPVELKAFAFPDQGPGRELELEGLQAVSDVGGFTLHGQAVALGLVPGHWVIVLVVGRPSAMPSAPLTPSELEEHESVYIATIDVVMEP